MIPTTLNSKNSITALAFILVGFSIVQITPSIDLVWVSGFLLLTVFVFAFELVSNGILNRVF